MAANSNKKMWPNNSAIIISDETNLALIMKTLIQPLNWRIDIPACTVLTAIDLFHQGLGSAAIVIDSATMPAHESLRTLFKDPRCRLLPTMVLVSEQCGNDITLYEKVFKTTVIKRPLNAANFIPTFKNLLKEWETPVHQALRTISYTPISDSVELKISVLERLLVDPNTNSLALPALVQILISQGNYKEAEKKLLEQFKLNPKNASILAQCGWFYMAAKMPHQALLFLSRLKSMAPQAIAINFDLVSAHLACGQITEASTLLAEWYKKFPNNEIVGSFLARILYSDGQQEGADKFGVTRQTMSRVSEAWEAIESDVIIAKTNSHNGNIAS